ncbi:MAG: DUF5615 family PIN-like protein [Candidatus Lokiarchaeota archaeon]|nr:DUF5615 family PIN-like protein [Candidatus Lokiarchaeota archaeon]
MEIIVDECLAKSTISCLIKAGFKVLKIEDILQAGIEDEKIFEHAILKKLPILTHDRGFGVLHRFFQGTPPLIIVLQVVSPHPKATNALLEKALQNIDLKQNKYLNKLIIISENNIRIR